MNFENFKMSDDERSSVDSEEFNNWTEGKIPQLLDSPGRYHQLFWNSKNNPAEAQNNFGVIPSREEVRKCRDSNEKIRHF